MELILNFYFTEYLIFRGRLAPRRKYDVASTFSVVALDTAFLFPCDGMTAILVMRDLFSFKVFARAMPNKSYDSTLTAIKSIFKESGEIPRSLECDNAKEYRKLQPYLTKLGCYVRFKYGDLKSSQVSESY